MFTLEEKRCWLLAFGYSLVVEAVVVCEKKKFFKMRDFRKLALGHGKEIPPKANTQKPTSKS